MIVAATRPPTIGLVLAGAAALGAYEVGVLSHLVHEVAPATGTSGLAPVLSGTSAGAINAAALAAFADAPAVGIGHLTRSWEGLRLPQILRPSAVELMSMFLDVTGAPARLRRALQILKIRGGLLDPGPIARLIAQAPIARIAEHLARGRLRGVAISATRVATGEAVVFHQARDVRPWPADEITRPVAAQLTDQHVLASAAIPLLFPPVEVGGEAFCDGGLRQLVPLSPAVHLGADELIVINPLPAKRAVAAPPDLIAVSSPLYLAGKALNALFADRVEADVARLTQTTEILRAGRRRYGAAFERELNAELAAAGQTPLRAIGALRIEPSVDLGALAAAYITSKEFSSRAPGLPGLLLRLLADGDPQRAGDLLAYLLFEGGFTSLLIRLGQADARTHHEALCALFARAGQPDVDRAGTGDLR